MSTCIIRHASVIGFILASAFRIAAQENKPSEISKAPLYIPGSGSMVIFLITKPGVQKEIGLEAPGSQKLLELLRAIDPTNNSFRTPEERRQQATGTMATMDETKQKSQAAVQKALSPDQFRRLQQLEMQYLGGRALLNPQTAQQLALSDDQQERLKTIRQAFRVADQSRRSPGVAGESRANDDEAAEKQRADLLAVLTPEQSKQFTTMQGTPFTVPKLFSGPLWRLAVLPEVQQELGLSESEGAKLVQSLTDIQQEGFAKLRTVSPAQEGRFGAEGRRQSEQIIDTVRDNLTVSQWNRLQELMLQQFGTESLAHPEVIKRLGLSRAQQDQVRETIAEFRRGFANDRTLLVRPDEQRNRQQKEHTALLEILTEDQKRQWDAMQGTKVDLSRLLTLRVTPGAE